MSNYYVYGERDTRSILVCRRSVPATAKSNYPKDAWARDTTTVADDYINNNYDNYALCPDNETATKLNSSFSFPLSGWLRDNRETKNSFSVCITLMAIIIIFF